VRQSSSSGLANSRHIYCVGASDWERHSCGQALLTSKGIEKATLLARNSPPMPLLPALYLNPKINPPSTPLNVSAALGRKAEKSNYTAANVSSRARPLLSQPSTRIGYHEGVKIGSAINQVDIIPSPSQGPWLSRSSPPWPFQYRRHSHFLLRARSLHFIADICTDHCRVSRASPTPMCCDP